MCVVDVCRYDVEAMRMVRRFKGHKDRVTGVVISQDARWLLSSSMDGTVRVWDIPAASCLQVYPAQVVLHRGIPIPMYAPPHDGIHLLLTCCRIPPSCIACKRGMHLLMSYTPSSEITEVMHKDDPQVVPWTMQGQCDVVSEGCVVLSI